MHTNYVLDAFTLRNEENGHKNMVLVVDTEHVRGVTNVSYADYVNKSDQDLENASINAELEKHTGRYF